MPYASQGTLTTDKREIGESETWETQTDWEAYQSISDVEISNGSLILSEPLPPDYNDVLAHYDATTLSLSDGDTVTSWPDQTGNGNDLSGTSNPSFDADGINGNAAVDFSLSNYLDVSFTSESQPNTIYIVFRFDSFDSGGNNILYDSVNGSAHAHGNDQTEYVAFAGDTILVGTVDTSNHISGVLWDGSSSTIRIDGSSLAVGNAGTGGLDGFVLGRDRNSGNESEVTVGEVIIYPQDKSGIYADIESYLSDKWGIGL